MLEGVNALAGDMEEKRLKPIINACYPGTLTALSLTVLQVTGRENLVLRLTLSVNAFLFLLSTFFIFFYTIYHWRKGLWTCTAVTFILGLFGSLIAVIMLILQ
jgi:hypothetical protein